MKINPLLKMKFSLARSVLFAASGLGPALILVAFSLSANGQGSLEPPPGSPGETMRTLTQTEPRVPVDSGSTLIDSPGSYYLTEDIVNDTIQIWASNVTLDLNGFSIRRDESPVSGAGISIDNPDGSTNNVIIKNGHIAGNWISALAGRGVSNLTIKNLRTEDTRRGMTFQRDEDGNVCEGIQILNCSFIAAPETVQQPDYQIKADNNGIKFTNGSNFRIQGCTISGFQGDAIDILMTESFVRPLGLIKECQIFNVGQNGIRVNQLADGDPDTLHIQDVTISLASLHGIDLNVSAIIDSVAVSRCGMSGLIATEPVRLQSSNFVQNGYDQPTQAGVEMASGTVMDCSAYANSGPGFLLGQVSVKNCSSTYNTREGYVLGDGSMIRDSMAATNGIPIPANLNSTNAGADGIHADNGVLVAGCTAYANRGDGIEAGSQALITRNQSYDNGRYGFNISATSSVRENNASNNGDGDYSTSGVDIAPEQEGGEATAPGYNTD
jgi:hypothetical protein